MEKNKKITGWVRKNLESSSVFSVRCHREMLDVVCYKGSSEYELLGSGILFATGTLEEMIAKGNLYLTQK